MKKIDELLPGVHLFALEPRADSRGFFARAFCRKTLAEHGIDSSVEQANLSLSKEGHTLRGLHYQLEPSAETKFVHCLRGGLFDVVLDLRPKSRTFGQWAAAELTEYNHQAVLVPPGCAHGFLTLEPDSLAFYLVSKAYDPVLERGVRFDDPAFAIAWPAAPSVVSARDRHHPLVDLARLAQAA